MKKIYEELFSGWTTKEAIYGWSLMCTANHLLHDLPG